VSHDFLLLCNCPSSQLESGFIIELRNTVDSVHFHILVVYLQKNDNLQNKASNENSEDESQVSVIDIKAVRYYLIFISSWW